MGWAIIALFRTADHHHHPPHHPHHRHKHSTLCVQRQEGVRNIAVVVSYQRGTLRENGNIYNFKCILTFSP